MPSPEFDLLLTLDDISCSWRILRVRNAVESLRSGALVQITTTDASLRPDLEAYVRQSGHLLTQSDQTRDTLMFVMQKR